MDYNFTADLENQLDEITSGKTNYLNVLETFGKIFTMMWAPSKILELEKY